jgi:hypothetical protein
MNILQGLTFDKIWAAFALSKTDSAEGKQIKRLIEISQQAEKERQLDIAYERERRRILGLGVLRR